MGNKGLTAYVFLTVSEKHKTYGMIWTHMELMGDNFGYYAAAAGRAVAVHVIGISTAVTDVYL